MRLTRWQVPVLFYLLLVRHSETLDEIRRLEMQGEALAQGVRLDEQGRATDMAIKARQDFDSNRSVTSRHRQKVRLQVVERNTSFSSEASCSSPACSSPAYPLSATSAAYPHSVMSEQSAGTSEPTTPRTLERANTNAKLATKHDDIQDQITHMHAKLPGYIRKLIAGYEMRVYWFEVAECGTRRQIIVTPSNRPLASNLALSSYTCHV